MAFELMYIVTVLIDESVILKQSSFTEKLILLLFQY